MNRPPKCAVLLAAYNGMRYIEEQILTITSQVGVQLTIFISLDYSSDGTKEWLDNLVQENPCIILLPYSMQFGSPAKNFFRLIRDVDFTSFDYIAFSDQDDHWHADKLIHACTRLRILNCDGYSSNVRAFWPDGKQQIVHKAQPQRRWDYLFEAAGPGCTYVMNLHLMTALKKRLIEHWDVAQTVSLHDWFTYAFARANGFQWIIDKKTSMLYRQHDNNQVGVNAGFKAKLRRIKKIINGWWLSQAFLIAQLVGIGDSPFVKSWSALGRFDLLRLARQAHHCRRNRYEQLLFFFCCLLLAVTSIHPIGKTQSFKWTNLFRWFGKRIRP